MATRAAPAVAAEKVADVKTKSDSNGTLVPSEAEASAPREARASGTTLAELRKAYPSLPLAAIRKAVDDVEPTTKPPVTTKRDRPVEPDYTKLPESKREAARVAYEKAIVAFEGKSAPKATTPKAPAKSNAKAKAPAAKKAPGRPRATVEPPSGFRSWDDPKLAARVLREKAKGSTIKAIAAGLGLPAEERYWHRVSIVFRTAADAKGIARPKLSPEALASRQARAAS